MKHKLLILLALALGLASNTRAEDVTISSATELVAFASRVNAGETSLNATLTDDIDLTGQTWTPIGNSTNKYAGTFDGQGYAITNFEYTATSDNNGLFGCTSGAKIRNFSISGTLTSNGYTKNGVVGSASASTEVSGIHSSLTINVSNKNAHTGGIVGGDTGGTDDKTVVKNCEYSGTLNHSGTGDNQAGILGYTGYGSVLNCIFSGTINGETSRYGGILGYCKQPSFGGVQNCLSIGKITVSSDSNNKGAIIGTWNGGTTSNVKNNYYRLKEGSNITRAIGGNTSNCEAPYAATEEQLASGEICYNILNGGKSNGSFRQTIETDDTPVHFLLPSSTSQEVYYDTSNYRNFADNKMSIDDKNDMVTFATIVNAGGVDLNAELTDDIDMDGADLSHFPIGTQANPYIGTFDGQGHKISNLQLINVSAPTSYGMFNTGANVTLKNFWLDSSCAIQGTEEVGLVGRHSGGGGSFEGLGNCGNVTGSKRRDGGIIGAAWGGDQTITIKNCWTTGTITGGAVNAGGAAAIIAWFNSATMVMENCWTIAEVSGATSDAKYVYDNGATNTSASTFTNCYSKKGTQPTFSNTISNEQLTSGELCYMLNGNTNGGTDWYQTIGTDNNPYPYSSGHGQVYKNGTFCRDTNFPQGVYSYGNADEVVTGDHDWYEGICSYCGYPKEDYISVNEGYYEIATPTQFKWFAAYVNCINPNVNAKLTANINLNNVTWTPIGNASNKYTGTFDGCGYTISNLTTEPCVYNGLFGYINGATVKDFNINGDIETLTSGTRNYIGVIGFSENISHISGILSSLNITVHCDSDAGGVLGSGGSDSTSDKLFIDCCSFSGKLNIDNGVTADQFGGIVGYTASATITNCLFCGTVSGNASGKGFGGIVGYTRQYIEGIQNCLSVGDISGTGGVYGTIIGIYNSTTDKTDCVKNNYYLSGSIAGAGKNSTMVSTTEKSAEELASGEVAYKLGSAWYQTIGTDANPVLDSSREKVLYVGAAGYSTFYDADKDWALSSYNGDAKAFIGTLTPSGGALHLEEIGDIPAKTAVVICGTYYNKVSTTATADATGNILIGSTGYTVPADRDIFALGIANNVVGFYPVVGGVNIPAGKAYLDLTDTAVKEFLTFVFDDATGINEELRMKNEESSEVIYNVAGQRLGKMQKGINIVNGKKIMVK